MSQGIEQRHIECRLSLQICSNPRHLMHCDHVAVATVENTSLAFTIPESTSGRGQPCVTKPEVFRTLHSMPTCSHVQLSRTHPRVLSLQLTPRCLGKWHIDKPIYCQGHTHRRDRKPRCWTCEHCTLQDTAKVSRRIKAKHHQLRLQERL